MATVRRFVSPTTACNHSRPGGCTSNPSCPMIRRRSHVVIATFEPLRGKETVEVLGWQKHVFAVGG